MDATGRRIIDARARRHLRYRIPRDGVRPRVDWGVALSGVVLVAGTACLPSSGAEPPDAQPRPSSCLLVSSVRPGHCARGARRCEACAAAARAEAKPSLLDLCGEGDGASLGLEISSDGGARWVSYEILRTFSDWESAAKHARERGIQVFEPAETSAKREAPGPTGSRGGVKP